MISVDDWSVKEGTIEELVSNIPTLGGDLNGVNYQLRKAEIKVQQEQIKLASTANELNEKLLLSNEQASTNSDKNAILMNNATQELAKSTKSLNWATWVLVAFTAVQASIALAAFFKK